MVAQETLCIAMSMIGFVMLVVALIVRSKIVTKIQTKVRQKSFCLKDNVEAKKARIDKKDKQK